MLEIETDFQQQEGVDLIHEENPSNGQHREVIEDAKFLLTRAINLTQLNISMNMPTRAQTVWIAKLGVERDEDLVVRMQSALFCSSLRS